MIKRNGQPRQGVAPPSLKRMSDTEYAAYFRGIRRYQGRLPGPLFDRRQAARGGGKRTWTWFS